MSLARLRTCLSKSTLPQPVRLAIQREARVLVQERGLDELDAAVLTVERFAGFVEADLKVVEAAMKPVVVKKVVTSPEPVKETAKSAQVVEPAPELPPAAEQTESWADATIAASKGKVSTGLDPVLMAAYTVKAATALRNGVTDFATWAAAMVRQFGESARKYLREAWDTAMKTSQVGAIGSTGFDNGKPAAETAEAPVEEPPGVAIKNAAVEQDLADFGLDPLVEPERRQWGVSWDQAAQREADTPGAAANLVTKAIEDPTTAQNEVDQALLTREYLRRRQTLKRARYEFNTANDNNRVDKEAAYDAARIAFQEVANATKVTGTEMARAFNSRKREVEEDYSLPAMLEIKQAETGGKPLSPEQVASVKADHAKLEQAQKIIDQKDKQEADATNKHYYEQLLKEMQAERDAAIKARDEALAKADKAAQAQVRRSPKLQKLVDRLQPLEDAAWARLKAKRGQVSMSVLGFDPADIADYAVIAASITAKSALKAEKLVQHLIKVFKDNLGVDVTPHINEIIAEAEKIAKDPEAEKAKLREKLKVIGDANKAREAGELDEDADVPALTPRMVADLLREQADDGVLSDAQAITNVTKIIQEYLPGITEREVSDLWSGYGKVTYITKDEADLRLLEWHRLRQFASALEDVRNKEAPERSNARMLIGPDGKPFIRKPTQKEREKLKELHDAMRASGITAQSSEEALASALDGIKTRLRNAIADIEKQIATGEKTKVRPKTEYDAEAKALKAELDKLRAALAEIEGPVVKTDAQLIDEKIKAKDREIAELKRKIATKDFAPPAQREVFNQELQVKIDEAEKLRAEFKAAKEAALGKPTMSDERRIELATAALEKSIASLSKRIAAGDIMAKVRGSKTPQTQQLQVLRDTRDALRKEMLKQRKAAADALRDPVAEQLKRDIKAINTRTAKLQERIAKKDFAPKVKIPPLWSKEKDDAQYAYEQARKEFMLGVFNDRLAKRTPGKKAVDATLETLNLSRAVLTSLDFSGVLRQGGFLSIGDPVLAARSLIPMFRAAFSAQADAKIARDLANRKNAKLYEATKLAITGDPTSVQIKDMEEAYMGRWIKKMELSTQRGLKGAAKRAAQQAFNKATGFVRGSERAYRTFLNLLRADTFDAMLANLQEGAEPTLDEAKAVASFINSATGRADLGRFNQAATVLNTVFFAPRLVASRFQMLAGAPLYDIGHVKLRGSARTRKLVLQRYARFLAGMAMVYALYELMSDDDEEEVVFDPRSSDFGKLRFGDTRVDMLAGLAQVTVVMARMTTGEKLNAKGKVVPLRRDYRLLNLFREVPKHNKVPYGGDSPVGVAGNFMRSKFSPVFGTVVNLINGKNVVGEETGPGTEIIRMIVPMSFESISEAMKEHGMSKGAAISALSIFGAGVQTYDPRSKSKGSDLLWFLDTDDGSDDMPKASANPYF